VRVEGRSAELTGHVVTNVEKPEGAAFERGEAGLSRVDRDAHQRGG